MTEPLCGATRTFDGLHYRCTRPRHDGVEHVDAEGHPDYLIMWNEGQPRDTISRALKTPAERGQENGVPTWPFHHQHSGVVAMEADPNALTRRDQLRIRALDAAAFHQRALIEGRLAAGGYAVSVGELLDSASMIEAWYERPIPEDS